MEDTVESYSNKFNAVHSMLREKCYQYNKFVTFRISYSTKNGSIILSKTDGSTWVGCYQYEEIKSYPFEMSAEDIIKDMIETFHDVAGWEVAA